MQTILFTLYNDDRSEGLYIARIDNLQVAIGNIGFEIVTYEDRTFNPCDGDLYCYTDYFDEETGQEFEFKNAQAGLCPDKRDPETCKLINCCPFEEIGNVWAGDSYASMRKHSRSVPLVPSYADVEGMVRSFLEDRHDLKRQHEKAVSEFLHKPWVLERR